MFFAAEAAQENAPGLTSGNWISIFAAAISVVSAVLTLWTSRRVLLAQYITIDRCIEATPSVLRFHGITAEDLETHGVSAAELSYLSSQFLMGSVYEKLSLVPSYEPYTEGSYHYAMCAAPATRRAWPLVKKLLSPSDYFLRIEATMALFPA